MNSSERVRDISDLHLGSLEFSGAQADGAAKIRRWLPAARFVARVEMLPADEAPAGRAVDAWSNRVYRHASIQDEIALAVVEHLELTLTGSFLPLK